MASQFWLLVILLLTSVLAEEEEDVGVANDYIDEVLQNLRMNKEIVEKIDPLHVPNIDEPKFKARDFWITGLSSLHRSGDCTISYDGEIIRVVGNIAVNDIRFKLNYKFKALFWISGVIDAVLDRLAVRVRLSVNQDSKKANLEELKVTEFGTIKIHKITGLSVLLNWALKLIAQSIVNKSKPKIIAAMETEVANILRKELAKLKVPLFL